MANKVTIKNSADALKKIKHHLDSSQLEVNKVYHIPPIISIKRMDIKITAIEGDDIKFKILNSPNDAEEKSMKKSSILSRFIVKKINY